MTIWQAAMELPSSRLCSNSKPLPPRTPHAALSNWVLGEKRSLDDSGLISRGYAASVAVRRSPPPIGPIIVAGFPAFDPEPGTVLEAPIEGQTELVLEQMKLCLETAGSSLEHVLKCHVYCTSSEHFAAVNAIYARYFPQEPPARIFVCVPAWPGPFDIEVDCIAVRRDQ